MYLKKFRLLTATTAAIALLAGCAGAPTSTTNTADAGSFTPVTLKSCGEEVKITAAPKAAVSLNQGATEVMLALGLEDRMAGTAWLDDQVPAKYKAAYDKVKVLAKEYPSKETFLAAKPDFVYSSYSSAFTEKGVGSRAELASEKIATYLSPFACPKKTERAPATMDSAWAEVTDIARAFGVKDRAEKLIDEQKAALAKLTAQGAGKGKKVFWYDSGDKQPIVGANQGGPQIILDTIGATNIFADLVGTWAEGSWEKVVAADPDVIVIADASWDTAAKKIAYLEADPVLSKLKAVKAKAYVTLPFSETTPGIRLVDGATKVAEQIVKIS